jgi:hypothetical protein
MQDSRGCVRPTASCLAGISPSRRGLLRLGTRLWREGRVAEILGPGVESIFVIQDRRALVMAADNNLVQQMGGVRTFLAFNSIESKFRIAVRIPPERVGEALVSLT